jgi:hypothetical protein
MLPLKVLARPIGRLGIGIHFIFDVVLKIIYGNA